MANKPIKPEHGHVDAHSPAALKAAGNEAMKSGASVADVLAWALCTAAAIVLTAGIKALTNTGLCACRAHVYPRH